MSEELKTKICDLRVDIAAEWKKRVDELPEGQDRKELVGVLREMLSSFWSRMEQLEIPTWQRAVFLSNGIPWGYVKPEKPKEDPPVISILIETSSSYQAKVTVCGRVFQFGVRQGAWRYLQADGKNSMEELGVTLDNSVAGLVALKIAQILPDLLQNWMPEQFEEGVWEALPEDEADRIYENLEL